jgi:hypothetical protein
MSGEELTLRLSAAARRRLARIAKREGRTREAQAERMLSEALETADGAAKSKRGIRPLAGVLSSVRAPGIDEFREVRSALARTLGGAVLNDDRRRR